MAMSLGYGWVSKAAQLAQQQKDRISQLLTQKRRRIRGLGARHFPEGVPRKTLGGSATEWALTRTTARFVCFSLAAKRESAS